MPIHYQYNISQWQSCHQRLDASTSPLQCRHWQVRYDTSKNCQPMLKMAPHGLVNRSDVTVDSQGFQCCQTTKKWKNGRKLVKTWVGNPAFDIDSWWISQWALGMTSLARIASPMPTLALCHFGIGYPMPSWPLNHVGIGCHQSPNVPGLKKNRTNVCSKNNNKNVLILW